MTVSERKMSIRRPLSERMGSVINYIVLTIAAFAYFLPVLYVVLVSFTSDRAIGKGGVNLFPAEWSLESYKFLFSTPQRVINAYKVTVIVAVVGTLLALFITAGMAYALSKKELPFRNLIMGYVFFSMLFGGGLIPWFLVVTKVLHLSDSIWSLILPGAYSTWNMILMRNFFMSLPDSLEESALLDGANEAQILFKIILPLSKPIMATLALFYVVAYWNSWYGALLFITDTTKWPLMLFLRSMIDSSNVSQLINPNNTMPPSEALKMAVVVVCTLPIICVYPFLQKYFVQGILIGSIKG